MLSDHALEIVRNSSEGVGAEVWRKFLWEYEPGVGIRYGAMLQSLLKRRFGEHDETDLAREIESLERDISKYEQQSRDLISDAIKHGIVCGGMAHQGLQQDIDPSIRRLSGYKALRDEIINYSRVCRTWRDPNAMQVVQCMWTSIKIGKSMAVAHDLTRARVAKAAEEAEHRQVKKDVAGGTVVTRNRRQRRMIQILVKVDGSKVTPMEVSLMDDKVEDVMRQIQKDADVYVTMRGRVLRINEKLKSCRVTNGCMIQVTSRLRGRREAQGQKEQSGKETRQGREWTKGPASWASERQVPRNDAEPEGRDDSDVGRK